jgi:hypothetical protein
LKRNLSVPFPSEAYANAAKNSIEVDPPFTDTKTKKTSIVREMNLRSLGNFVFLDVTFRCNEDEVGSMRTCVSSFVANMSLVCETMKEFGN